jgi:hypothetical protein
MGAGIVVGLLLAASTARAQSEADKKRAVSLQTEGVKLMQRGDNPGALAKFEEAYRLVASPKILFNMGRAHADMGDDVKALGEFERFLDEAPYAPKESRDEATRRVEALRPKLSYLDIQTDDVGAAISIDGASVGMAPLARPLVVKPGAHEVRTEKPDMTTDVRTVSPLAGQKVRVVVKLVPAFHPVPGAPPPVAGTLGTEPAAGAGAGPSATLAAPPIETAQTAAAPPADRARTLRIVGLALGAGGVAVAAVGLGFGLAARANGQDNEKTGNTFSQSAYDAGHRDQTLQFVGYAVGGALIAAGVTTYVLGGREAGESGSPHVSRTPTSGGAFALGAFTF